MDPVSIAAISWSFSAAGWLISPLLTRFLNKCIDALGTDSPFKSRRKKKLQKKVKKLETTLLPQLLILTEAAKQSLHRKDLEKWLLELKSAFYEAEDVFGLVEYARLEKLVNSNSPSSSKLNLNSLKFTLPKFSLKEPDPIKSLEKIEKIVKEGMEFVDLLNLPNSSVSDSTGRSNVLYRETISIPDFTVIGRDKDRDEIVKLLRQDVPRSSSNVKCYSVIGICGMGGSGKTTLAQYVCNYEKQAKYFDQVIWVHVSENFDVEAIMRSILESIFYGKKSEPGIKSLPKIKSLDVLSSKLVDSLRGQKYLLVLDDVWCNKRVREQEVNQLFATLRNGKKGSKILVTTREEEAARNLHVVDLIKLPELADEDFYSLFMSHALRDVNVDKHQEERLRAIGKDIVERLCHSPLAAITVAGQLCKKPEPRSWSSMLRRSFLSNDVMGVLYLSYQHLTLELQRCFAFCSLFPKGHHFNPNHLVRLWIAEGFIEPTDSNEHMKDVAHRYFQELVSCSFFQVEKKQYDIDLYYYHYYMHDLIHDLAEHVSQGECFQIRSGDKKDIPIQVRHLSVADDVLEEYLEKICKLKDLRTIIVQPNSWLQPHILKEVDIDALFTELRKLYIVDLPHIENLPKSVIHLKNLRYLTLKIAQTATIPDGLDVLYQLRTLCIQKTDEYFRALHMEAIHNVGRLRLLQNLEEFQVKTEPGFELKQLEHLNDLYGTLIIRSLHTIKNGEEVHQEKLSQKRGIRNLHCCWDYGSEDVLRDIDVVILDSLCPPPQIEKLAIEGYSGRRLSSWIIDNGCKIPELEHLELSNCRGLETLQNIGELSNLLSLTICSLPRLKSWEPLPTNLTELTLTNCLSLVFGLKEDLQMIMSVRCVLISHMATFLRRCGIDAYYDSVHFQSKCVHEMMKLGGHIDAQACLTIVKDLKKCFEKMLELICQLTNVCGELYCPPSLEKVSIGSCFITDKALAMSLQGLTSLTQMELLDIITITCIPEEVLSSLTSLRDLDIRGCLLITSIGGWDTHSTLENFQIEYCPNLALKTSIVANSNDAVKPMGLSSCCRKATSSNLKYVFLRGCILTDDMFQNLVSLKTIQIQNCPITMVNLHMGYLKSLVDLKLMGCRNLISLRGLNELKDLKSFCIRECQNFTGSFDAVRKTLQINRLSLIEQLIPRDALSSLISLTIQDEEEEFSKQECEVLQGLSSLEEINFHNCKMRSLPNLQCVQSLRYLDITYCPLITSLPELPPSLQELKIQYCNEEFTRSCHDANDPNWHKIFRIPKKDIREPASIVQIGR